MCLIPVRSEFVRVVKEFWIVHNIVDGDVDSTASRDGHTQDSSRLPCSPVDPAHTAQCIFTVHVCYTIVIPVYSEEKSSLTNTLHRLALSFVSYFLHKDNKEAGEVLGCRESVELTGRLALVLF